MGMLSGGMTLRRFRVVGELPPSWRTDFVDRLHKMAFREPKGDAGKEEYEGWVRVQNLLDTDFADLDGWLFQQFAVFCLRVDKKTLPGKLLAAHVDKRCREEAEKRGITRVPSSLKKEIKEKLETEWLERALPRVTLVELCWNTQDGWLVLGNTSDAVADRIRKRFQRTFNLDLVPWSPLDAVKATDVRESLLASAPTSPGGEA